MEFEELFDLMNRCKVLQEELNQIKENLEKGLFKNIVYDDKTELKQYVLLN